MSIYLCHYKIFQSNFPLVVVVAAVKLVVVRVIVVVAAVAVAVAVAVVMVVVVVPMAVQRRQWLKQYMWLCSQCQWYWWFGIVGLIY
jgi:hypothetical protein